MRTTSARTYGIVAGLALIAVSLLASTTWAGQKRVEVVTVNTGNPAMRYAGGSLGSARASDDLNQTIGCTIRDTGVVTCFARNAINASLMCTTSDAGFRDAAHSLNGDSRIYFSVDATGTCLSLTVENQSYWAPKGT